MTQIAQINFAGTLSLSIIAAAYAIADDFKTSHMLVASMLCGAIGSMFALVALLFDRGQDGQCFVRLSLLSVATGTVCIVGATQIWEITLLTSTCIVVVSGAARRIAACTR